MNLNAEDPLKIQVKLAEDPIKIQIHMPETSVIRVESGAGPQGPKGKQGDKGDDYVLTEKDKDDIAELAADKVDLSDYAKKTEVPIESGTGVGSAKIRDFEYDGTTYSNEASGTASKAEGISTIASGANSHAEGNSTVASGGNAHSEGAGTTASGNNAHSEGAKTTASGIRSHAEGTLTVAYGTASHAEGQETYAEGTASHAEGSGTIANADSSHVSGTYNTKDNWNLWPEWISGTSYAVGDKVKYIYRDNLRGFICKTANSDTEFSVKKWTPDTSRDFAEIIGNGTSDDSRSNAYALTWTGNGKYAGDVYVHSNPDSSGGDKLATEDYVDDAVSHISSMAIHICTAQEYDAQTGIPTIANPDATTFYLVPGGDAPNLYVEWIYTNNAWEQFGSASIDLSNYVQKTDYASASNAGVVKISGAMGIDIINGFLTMATADHAYIQDGIHARKAIPPKFQHESAFYGLAKAAGDSTQSQSDNAVGTYTPEAKTAIQHMLGAGDGDTVSYLANAAWSEKIADPFFYTELTSEDFDSERETETNLIARVNADPITMDELGYASYIDFIAYDANNDGIYHVELIKDVDGRWLSPFSIEVSAIYPMKFIEAENLKIKISAVGNEKYIVDFILQCKDEAFKNQLKNAAKFSLNVCRTKNVGSVMIDNQDVAKGDTAYIPFASNEQAGVVKVSSDHGLAMNDDNQLELVSADETEIKDGIMDDSSKPITPAFQHAAAFYGLATAAGDWTQASSENYVGEYTDEAKGAIQQMIGVSQIIAPVNVDDTATKAYAVGEKFTMKGRLYKATSAIAQYDLIVPQNEGEEVSGHNAEECKVTDAGAVQDVQVNGVSVLQDGVANVPVATTSMFGAIKIGSGLDKNNNDQVYLYNTPDGFYKSAFQNNAVIINKQHLATFYGLAKAAGDTTQSQSGNAVGTYTDEAKVAIRTMLGLDDQSIIDIIQAGLPAAEEASW